jgi:hypothetical protein
MVGRGNGTDKKETKFSHGKTPLLPIACSLFPLPKGVDLWQKKKNV